MSIFDTLLPKEERQVVRSDSMDTRMFTELREQSGNLQKVEKEGTERIYGVHCSSSALSSGSPKK
jgi:hypothetical protein